MNCRVTNLYRMGETEFSIYILLFIAALLAGFVDSIAGGGGLIVTPALLIIGMPPLNALATNKVQAVFGSSTAALNYGRKIGKRDIKIVVLFCFAFIGSIIGTFVISNIDPKSLMKLIPYILIAVALFFAFKGDLDSLNKKKILGLNSFALVTLCIGAYDGFGPGTGTFFMIAFVSLRGMTLLNATYSTKVVNFASNLGSLLTFINLGLVNWSIGLVMGVGQVIGAYLGSNLTLNKGAAIIKPTLIVVSLLMSISILINNH